MAVSSPMLRGDTPSAPNAVALKPAPKKGRAKKGCKHHYVIEEPHGKTSRGVCKKCGRGRRFDNAYQGRSARERFKR